MTRQTSETHQKTFILALLIGLALRLLFIAQVPGIHFDEAWAANFAAKIANQRGFWPLDAMSPYTRPWSHYLTSVFFKCLGDHLWVGRLAGILMSGLGIVFIARSLSVSGEKKAAAYFACLAAVCVPSILNERFAIEINTFHVFCLGLFVFGVVTQRRAAVLVAAIFGVTSHILFLAPVLAAFGVWAFSDQPKNKQDRVLVSAICFILLPFFVSVYLGIPEKNKALALIGIDLSVLFYTFAPFSISRWERKLRWLLVPVVVFVILILAAMMEGDLSILFTLGKIKNSWISLLAFAMVLGGLGYLLPQAWRQIRAGLWPRNFAPWIFYFILIVAAMSTKPAPRYFEMVFLAVLAALAVTLARLSSQKVARVLVCIFVLISTLQWRENYIVPALDHEGVDRSFRYLVFHDNSSDSLPKQNLVAQLASEGCAFEQVSTSDPRLGEALRFLSLGDWRVDESKKCPSQHIKIETAASGASGKRFEEFVLFYE